MTRDLTGNQWRDLMTGVMWSCFWVCVISRATLCWRSCRRWMSLSGKPKSNELQLSSLEVAKEWTSCSAARGVKNLTILFDHVDLVTTWLTQCADVLLHTEMRVKYYTQIFLHKRCQNCWITNLYCRDAKLLQKRCWSGDDKVSFFRRSVGVYWLPSIFQFFPCTFPV